MRTDKIRKYVLPNIPYLFIGWACLKMGMTYRLAAGANFGEKLLGLMQTIGVAFADFSPGLDPFDWLIGIVGAVAFRLLIYFKSKNAKKYRRDEEYGSSRWGGPKDIQPFVDPKFENNVILTGTELLTMNTRPKIPANARNLNACTRTAGAKQLPSQACFIVPIAAARCMSTVPTTASVFLNIPVPNTAKSQLESSARHSTVSMKMWYCPLFLKC